MIEMDEELYSPLDDAALLLVLLFCGQDAKDKLLYRSEEACMTIYSQPLNHSSATG